MFKTDPFENVSAPYLRPTRNNRAILLFEHSNMDFKESSNVSIQLEQISLQHGIHER